MANKKDKKTGDIKLERKDKVIGHLEKKNQIMKTCALSVGIIFVFIFVFLVGNGTIVFSKEKRLSNDFQMLGQKFYTDFYYEQVSTGKSKKEVSNFLSQFKEVGIKVSLGNIEKYNAKDNNKKIKKLEKNKCSKTDSIVTIYPASPYGKNNYTLKVTLKCDSLK
mgnify:FL=1